MNLYKEFKTWLEEIWGIKDLVLEKPRQKEHGHFATPIALALSKKEGKNPREVAESLKTKVVGQKFKDYELEVEIAGPGFLNFRFPNEVMVNELQNYISKGELCFDKKDELVMIEYLSPNTNKPLHIGHLRNLSLGFSVGKLLQKIGYNVHFTEILNDRGIAICKSMLAYKLFGEGDTPEKSGIKGDAFIGKYYVLFGNKLEEDSTLEDQAQDMLVAWENGDEEVVDLWKKMLEWYYEGNKQTVESEKIHFDSHYFESDIYKDGTDLIMKFTEQGKFQKETEGDLSGTITVDLTDKGLDKKVLIRSNGTAIYMTQDLVLADIRDKEYSPDKMIYVVANEQDYHFKVLFELFKIIGYKFSENCYHLSYGFVTGKEGKFSARKGNVIYIDDLVNDLELAVKEIISKSETTNINDEDLETVVPKIALAARRYEMLKYDAKSDFVFDLDEATKLDGNSGPYLLYTFARINSILEKSDSGEFEVGELNKNELDMLAKLNDFKMIVERSAEEYKPHFLTTYLYELCQEFNAFYANCHVLKEEDLNLKNFRIFLLQITLNVLNEGLDLLGISPVRKM